MTDNSDIPDWARPAHEAVPDVPDWAKPAYSSTRASPPPDATAASVPDWAKPATASARAPAPSPATTSDVPDWARAATPAPENTPGLGELAKRGFVQGGATLLRSLQGVGDSFTGQGLAKQITESQMPPEARAAFHEQAYPLDTLAKNADEYAAPAPGEAAPGLAGRVVQGASKLLPEVAGVIATGGEGAVPEAVTAAARAVPYVGRVLGGIAEGLPTAAKFTTEQASSLPDDMTPGQKLAETAKDFGVNAAMAGLPAALGASPLVRVPTGAAIGAGQSAALSALEGQPQDAAQNIIGAIQGGAFGLVPHAPREAAPGTRADSKINAPGFESHPPTDNEFDRFHEPEGLMNPFDVVERRARAQEPAQSDYKPNLVADENGVLRAAPVQPERPQMESEHLQSTVVPDRAQPAQAPDFPDPNAGPISRAAAQVTPAHQAEQGIRPAPPFPDAETGSLAHAANAIDPFPFESPPREGPQIEPNKTQHADDLNSTKPDMPKGSEQALRQATQPAFRVEPLGSQGLLVHGDPDAVRQQLAIAGFAKRGRVQEGALRFDAKDRDAIEQALFSPQGNDEAISFPNATAKETQAAQADDVPPPIPDHDLLEWVRTDSDENLDGAQDSAELAGLQKHEHQEPTYVAAASRAWREQGTDSPFFRHWFGDSKVVDAQGKPRTVFHGTSEDFNVFRDDKLGDNTGHMTAPLGHFLTES
ncbi:MAG: hypothetical protein QM741_10860 [Rudaea sp.]|uniref:hypothetical protein n=1 Tax=Rudaea sp. TaxID=2136325 RepID=UPI0039E2EA01